MLAGVGLRFKNLKTNESFQCLNAASCTSHRRFFLVLSIIAFSLKKKPFKLSWLLLYTEYRLFNFVRIIGSISFES